MIVIQIAGPDGSVFSIQAFATLLNPVPEPGTASMLALGLCGLVLRARHERRRRG